MLGRLLLLSLLLAAASPAQDLAGRYRLEGGPDVASELILYPDGRFEYGLSAGALDEGAAGTWKAEGGRIRLTTIPKPVPPRFVALAASGDPAAPLVVKVVSPRDEGIAGVDFRIGFTDGSTFANYTQEYGWSADEGDRRRPAWIELSVPMHGLVSPRFTLDAAKGSVFVFRLIPNDLGMVDFEGQPLDAGPGRLVMHRNGHDMIFTKSGGPPPPRH
jgi:hypothetical protein